MSTADISSLHSAMKKVYKLLTRGKVPAELSNCNLTPFEFTDEHILEATTPNFFELRKPVRGNLAILQAQAFQIKFEFFVPLPLRR